MNYFPGDGVFPEIRVVSGAEVLEHVGRGAGNGSDGFVLDLGVRGESPRGQLANLAAICTGPFRSTVPFHSPSVLPSVRPCGAERA